MTPIVAWLANRPFESVSRRDGEWVFVFGGNVQLVVQCLWRMLEGGRIRMTSLDDGHQFGLPEGLDAAAEINRRLMDTSLLDGELVEGTLDLRLRFSSGHILEALPDSSGYESWNLRGPGKTMIAVGGGDLAIVDDNLGVDIASRRCGSRQ